MSVFLSGGGYGHLALPRSSQDQMDLGELRGTEYFEPLSRTGPSGSEFVCYDGHCDKQYGLFWPVLDEMVQEYLRFGDLSEGFVSLRCTDPGHKY